MTLNKRKLGSSCEDTAAFFLEGQNYVILEKRFRCRQGEIDIIARDGRYLIFIEVKYRRSGRQGHPLEAVNHAKQRQISKVALCYMNKHGISLETAMRFDVIGVTNDEIIHIKNAFDFCC